MCAHPAGPLSDRRVARCLGPSAGGPLGRSRASRRGGPFVPDGRAPRRGPERECAVTDTGLLTEYSATIELDRYEDIRAALFDPNLSRSFDKRSYEDGNIRSGIVSIAHGAMHRTRRRVENTQFRADVLRLYERDLFPKVMNDLLDRLIDSDHVDLFPIGEMLSVVLAARRSGIEY